MAAQAKQPANWLVLDQIINKGMEQVETNLSRQQVFALGALFKNVQPEQIQSASLVGHGTPKGGGAYRVGIRACASSVSTPNMPCSPGIPSTETPASAHGAPPSECRMCAV